MLCCLFHLGQLQQSGVVLLINAAADSGVMAQGGYHGVGEDSACVPVCGEGGPEPLVWPDDEEPG